MPEFCFKCRACGNRGAFGYYPTEPVYCGGHSGPMTDFPMVRDYRAEAVGINTGNLRALREHGLAERLAKTLPTNVDFAGPGDPDGKKGMRAWRDEHEPRPSNKRPAWPGEVERKVF